MCGVCDVVVWTRPIVDTHSSLAAVTNIVQREFIAPNHFMYIALLPLPSQKTRICTRGFGGYTRTLSTTNIGTSFKLPKEGTAYFNCTRQGSTSVGVKSSTSRPPTSSSAFRKTAVSPLTSLRRSNYTVLEFHVQTVTINRPITVHATAASGVSSVLQFRR